MDVAFDRLHSNASVLGFYGFFDIHIAVGNANVHIVRCNYAAFPGTAVAYGNVARTHGHVYFVVSLYLCAYVDLARLDIHLHIMTGSYVFAHSNVALSESLQIHIVAGFHISSYHYVAICNNRCVYIITCFDAVIYIDVAGSDCHVYIIVDSFHIRAYGNVAAIYGCVNTLTCNDAVANIDFSFTYLHRYAARLCRYGMTYRDVAFIRLHGQAVLYRQVFSKGNITLYFRLRIERTFCRHVIRHHQVAVLRNQIRVIARFHFSVLAKDDVIPIRVVLFTGGFHPDVAFYGGRLTVNRNLTISRFQIHILFGHNRFHVFPVIANRNVAICHLYIHIAVLGLHGLIYGYASASGYIQRHTVACHHISFFVAAYLDDAIIHGHVYVFTCSYVFAHQDVTFAHCHGYIIACGDGFTYGNITGACLRNHIAGYVHISLKGYITNIIDRYGHILFRQGITSYFNITVRCMHRQIAARIQHTVMGDLNTSCAFLFLIQRFYSDIAILRLGGAVHGNCTVRYIQVDVLLRQDRL